MNLLHLLNLSHHDFYFLVVDPSLSISLPQLEHFTTISPASIGIPKIQNSGQLLSHPKTIEYIKRHTHPPRQVAIVPFKPSSKLNLTCRREGWTLVANPASINRFFEDKIKFSQICSDNKLPGLPSIVSPLSQSLFSSAQKQFGQKLVIQTHFGWAGKSTFAAGDWSEVVTRLPPSTPVKITPFFNGYTLLNNCCLIHQGLLQSPPALQFTGIKPLTQNPFTTVGRQWPCFAPPNIINQIKIITTKFSSVLTQHHYRGFFGLDFLVHRNHVYLLECNPRLTASFAFYTDLELRLGLTPLFFFHLLEFLNLGYNFNLSSEQQRFSRNDIIGSEITGKDQNGKTLNKYQQYNYITSNPEQIRLTPSLSKKVNGQR